MCSATTHLSHDNFDGGDGPASGVCGNDAVDSATYRSGSLGGSLSDTLSSGVHSVSSQCYPTAIRRLQLATNSTTVTAFHLRKETGVAHFAYQLAAPLFLLRRSDKHDRMLQWPCAFPG